MQSLSEITILFEDPFWVAVFEQYEDGSYAVAREVIGTSEPTGAELLLFFKRLDESYLRFSKWIKKPLPDERSLNFKRRMREAWKSIDPGQKHVYTKAQGLIKQNQKEFKESWKKLNRQIIAEKELFKYELRHKKKREKLRGH
jgi:hypothetical protein